ncbi:metalloendopeptidase-like membrane protein [Haloferax mediterranei ATCC 33500]|nr:metalloendopeptidase-like membrane protein [Haloferax mediterranei ATCC 33500]
MLGFLGFLGDAFSQLEILKLFKFFWLFAFWPIAAMLFGAIRNALGYEKDSPGPRDWLSMDDSLTTYLAFFVGLLLSFFNPLALCQDMMQLLGSIVAIVRNRGSLPDPESYEQSGSYRLPVEGTWTVINGSPIKKYSHSWFPATQRYAHDFVITDEDGRTHPEGTDTNTANYYCYDQPVVAPADGTVVSVGDSDPELSRGGGFSHPFKRSIIGNHVAIRHAEGEYSNLVHLVPGSIEVEPGDHVKQGEQIGRCGHTGNSSEPHLHFQLQDHPTFEIAAGLPVKFENVDIEIPGTDVVETTDWSTPEDEDSGRYIHVGQRVTHNPDDRSHRNEVETKPSETSLDTSSNRAVAVGVFAKGISIGGILTVFAGAVVSSLSTVAVVLTGSAALAVAYWCGRRLLSDDPPSSSGLVIAVAVGLTALSVGAAGELDTVSGFSSFSVGGGMFVIGFLLYGVTSAYLRYRLSEDDVAGSLSRRVGS